MRVICWTALRPSQCFQLALVTLRATACGGPLYSNLQETYTAIVSQTFISSDKQPVGPLNGNFHDSLLLLAAKNMINFFPKPAHHTSKLLSFFRIFRKPVVSISKTPTAVSIFSKARHFAHQRSGTCFNDCKSPCFSPRGSDARILDRKKCYLL